MTKKLALLAVMACAVAGPVQAQSLDVIEVRQAGQDVYAGTFAGIRAVATAKGDVKTLENPGKYMARWIKVFPTLFPKGSEQGGGTKALPAIWSDMAGFQKIANESADAALKLAEFAKAGDADGVNNQIKILGDTCGACHRAYRAR